MSLVIKLMKVVQECINDLLIFPSMHVALAGAQNSPPAGVARGATTDRSVCDESMFYIFNCTGPCVNTREDGNQTDEGILLHR